MWAIRVLKGQQAGQVFKLNAGSSVAGRGPTCQIQLTSGGVSKEHARFDVTPDGLKITDLKSRNGIFVNGLKVRARALQIGDKVLFHDVLLEIVDGRTVVPGNFPSALPAAPQAVGNLALQNWEAQSQTQPEGATSTENAKSNYIEDVVMPGVYRLAEVTEFRYVIGLFVLGLVVLVTILSVIPMSQLMRSGLERESQRRAMTIAQALHDRYQIAMTNSMSGAFDTRFAEREPGVRAAFIISPDGSILAPVSRAGAFANEPFVASARKQDERTVTQIDSQTIGASIPIEAVDPETGLRQPKAFAMVIYDMGSLAVDSGQVLSLFIRVLGIALILGFVLYFLLHRLMEAPFTKLSLAIDQSLRKGDQKVESAFKLEPYQNLIVSVNSLISRVGAKNVGGGAALPPKDSLAEASPLVRSFHNPAFAVETSGRVLVVNSALAQLLNSTLQNLEGVHVSQLPDDAIAGLTKEILEQAQQTGMGSSTPIHLQGRDLELSLHPIRTGDVIDYYVASLYDPNRDEVPT